MTFDIYADGKHLKVETIVGDGITRVIFTEIEPEPEPTEI